jgi:hypothetical protein
MTKQTENQQRPATFSVFGSKAADALLVPEIPIAVRNNCQSGQWAIGDTDYGSKCSMTILKFSKYFGSLGKTDQTLWGQIWFVAESGDLPKGVVMVTHIKTQSLRDFNRLVTEVQSRGVEPATGIFTPTFKKFTNDKGNYYALIWTWEERKDFSILEQAAAVISSPTNQARMIDFESTKGMQCLDNLTQEETAYIMSGNAYSQQAFAATNDVLNVPALPSAS